MPPIAPMGRARYHPGDHQLREALGGLPLSHPQVRAWLEAYLQEGIQSLYAETGMKTVYPLEG
ncbi:MAG: hypothetical protein H5T66_05530 [Chloroflexi bacterium]|nr:hypothetical protein [Chloroflexota bacterium]